MFALLDALTVSLIVSSTACHYWSIVLTVMLFTLTDFLHKLSAFFQNM